MNKSVKLQIHPSEISYDILVTDEEPFNSLTTRIRSIGYSNLIIVTNAVVWKLYSSLVTSSFKTKGLTFRTIILPDGEKYKNLKMMQRIYDRLLSYKADRSSILLGIGGGVIGDITGFAASTYMRGIRYIQVPTTLLAQVDAAIGGKTAVDYASMKNIIGAFYQPIFVYSNVRFFKTLPARIYRSGLAEVIKYGAIKDTQLFSYIGTHRQDILTQSPRSILKIVHDSSRIKAGFVEKDEKETTGIRMLLNFGHTFGHAIESITQYKILHGEAVGIGMVLAAKLSHLLHLCEKEVPEKIEQIVRDVKLPAALHNLNLQYLNKSINYDKKSKADKINLILLKEIGVPLVYKMDKKMLKKILAEVKI